MVGQQRESGWNVDWPRGEALGNYTRTMNWEAKTMKEEFDRKPGMNPASWKYGSGWKGGTPLQQHPHQTFVVNGKHAWHIDGRKQAGRSLAGRCRALATGPMDEPTWLSQSREIAGSESESRLALGAAASRAATEIQQRRRR